MKVLFAASECAPFVKSGGLGDVIGALPGVLNNYGADARVILPKYSTIPKEFSDKMKHIEFFEVELGWRKLYCGILEMEYEGVHYYFVDNEYFFKRPELYGYDDDCERFAFFSKAILKFVKVSKTFTPDVIHCNDWHTGLVPIFKKEIFGESKKLEAIKTVFTIHNIKHQGIFTKNKIYHTESLFSFQFEQRIYMVSEISKSYYSGKSMHNTSGISSSNKFH